MRPPMRLRPIRVFCALLALVAASGACTMSVDVVTTLHAGGDGTFRIAFAFDKEFIDLVQTSEEGRASLAQIRGLGDAFKGSDWRVATTQPAGGLRIEIERDFADAKDLREALDDAAVKGGGSLSFLNILDRKSTRLNSSHIQKSRMPSSA